MATRIHPKNVHEKSPKNVHEMSPKKTTSRGQKCPRNITKCVHKMSPLLSTRCHLLCPRDVCHPSLLHTYMFKRKSDSKVQSLSLCYVLPLQLSSRPCLKATSCILISKVRNSSQQLQKILSAVSANNNWVPYERHYNPLLIRNRSWILTIHMARILIKKAPWKNVLYIM